MYALSTGEAMFVSPTPKSCTIDKLMVFPKKPVPRAATPTPAIASISNGCIVLYQGKLFKRLEKL
jgi:hypothetical protein